LFLIDLAAFQLTNNHRSFAKRDALLRHLQEAANGHYHDEEKCNQRLKTLLYLTIRNKPMPSSLKAKP
jgi:hypothetical protein